MLHPTFWLNQIQVHLAALDHWDKHVTLVLHHSVIHSQQNRCPHGVAVECLLSSKHRIQREDREDEVSSGLSSERKMVQWDKEILTTIHTGKKMQLRCWDSGTGNEGNLYHIPPVLQANSLPYSPMEKLCKIIIQVMCFIPQCKASVNWFFLIPSCVCSFYKIYRELQCGCSSYMSWRGKKTCAMADIVNISVRRYL